MNEKKALIALQFYDNSARFLRDAFSFARTNDSKIFIVHVIEEYASYSHYYDSYKLWEEFRASAVKESLSKIMKYLKEAEPSPGEIEPIIEVGDPCDKILETADRLNADMIIVGHRPHTVVDRILHSSTCEKIIKYSRRSVLSLYMQ